MFENNTNMPAAVRRDGVDELDHLPDADAAERHGATREFRTAFTDKGPEFIP